MPRPPSRQRLRAPQRPRLRAEELEPRILYSADAAALLGLTGTADAAQVRIVEGAPVASPVAEAQEAQDAREIVFVDSRVPDAMALVDALMQQRGNGHSVDIVMLDAAEDGIAQINRVLANEHGLAAIHVISHGSDGAIEIGSTHLDVTRLAQDADHIALWGQALSTNGDLLLYGCNVAGSAAGQLFVHDLSELTGADVAASTDTTGSAALGGNWTLEFATGHIHTTLTAARFDNLQWQGALATLFVTNTNDSGAGSLRDAITFANFNPGADTINFLIAGTGVHTITLASLLPAITGAVTLDATTDDSFAANGNRPAIVLDGNNSVSDGLRLYTGSDGSTVRGLVIERFTQDGIDIASSHGNTIVGNWIGLDADGSTGAGNQQGVNLWNSNSNTIGGSAAADRNVISGNSGLGVSINTDNGTSTGNLIRGNYIGTDASGMMAVGNGNLGVYINAAGNTVGGSVAGQGNVISGTLTWHGIGLGLDANGTLVAGNLIGLNAAGNAALANAGVGIEVLSANNTIGGVTAAARNVVSGNTSAGIELNGASATGNVVIGNYIGTDVNGMLDMNGNASIGGVSGVVMINGASGNRIGTDADGSNDAQERNLVSGNNWFGVEMIGPGTNNNVVQGNYIGTDATGLAALGNNSSGGVSIWNGASGNVVGSGLAGAGNVISGNGTGLLLGNGVTNNKIQGNLIGLGADGNTAVGNTGDGVYVYNGGSGALVTGNLIGTDADGSNDAAEGNVISANFDGVTFLNAEVTGNTIAGNSIGTDVTGLLDRGNTVHGVYLSGGAHANTVGGSLVAQRNLISGNNANGITVDGEDSDDNVLRSNWIGVGAGGASAIGNGGHGIYIANGSDNTQVGGTGANDGNWIASAALGGVFVKGDSTGTVIQGNRIGTDLAGTANWGTGQISILLENGASQTLVGGTTAGAGNIVANAGQGGLYTAGIAVIGANSTGNVFLNNSIHDSYGLGIDLGNNGVTTNDANDADSGPNNLLNALVLNSVATTGSLVRVSGTYTGALNTYYRVEVFANTSAELSGTGEGRTYLGAVNMPVGASGTVTGSYNFAVSVAAGSYISATVTRTDASYSTFYETSEFSNQVLAQTPGISVTPSSGLTTSEAGASAQFSVVLDTAPTANVTIALASSDTSEGTPSTSSLTFTPANWNVAQFVTVTRVDDTLDDGDVAYTVTTAAAVSGDAAYNGLNASDALLTSTDDDNLNTIVVDTAADTLDGNTSSLDALLADRGADGRISLREAIIATNNTVNGSGGADRIAFAIAGTGEHVINVGTALPTIDDAVVIDASTDDSFAANGNRPAIVLDGNNTPGDGLTLGAQADGSTVRGLVIRDFGGAGILVQAGSDNNLIAGNDLGRLTSAGGDAGLGEANGGSGLLVQGAANTIGGTASADRNVISGNGGAGIGIDGAAASGNVVIGNYIGTGTTGLVALGNSLAGVALSNGASGNQVGSGLAGAGNVISGNGGDGVALGDETSDANSVCGNRIGVNAAGTGTLANANNGLLIFNGADGTLVGGTGANEGNWIAGNGWAGIAINGASSGTVIQGNRIGTDLAGTANWGHQWEGIWLQGGVTDTLVGGTMAAAANVIAFNGQSGLYDDGISVEDATSTGNVFLGNAIYGNVGLGIDLGLDGVTANDAGDADTGPNSRQNTPVLTLARTDGSSQLVVSGTLESLANSHYRIEFYASATQDGTGHGEGQRWLGFANVATDGSGQATYTASFATTVAIGEFIGATATRSDATYAVYTDTSEFAQNLQASTAPTATNLGAAETYTEDTVLNLSDIVIVDADSATVSATLTLSNAAAGGLGTATAGTVTSTYNSATGVWTASGAIADVNALLAGLVFVPTADFNGSFSIATSVSDGAGAALSGTKLFTGVAVNDVPVASAPATLVVLEDGSVAVTGLALADPDAGSSLLRAELSVSSGTLAATSGGGVGVAGSGSATLVLSGTLANLNAYLASASRPIFSPDADQNGAVTLSFLAADGLPTGTGGTLTAGSVDYRFSDGTPAGSDPDNVPTTGGITGVTSSIGAVGSLATALSGGATSFGVVYSATLQVNAAGSYSFTVGADDAAKLYIDGSLAVFAWHGSASNSVALAAGQHSLELRFAQDVGGAGLNASYAGPDTGAVLTPLMSAPNIGRLVGTAAHTAISVAPVDDTPSDIALAHPAGTTLLVNGSFENNAGTANQPSIVSSMPGWVAIGGEGIEVWNNYNHGQKPGPAAPSEGIARVELDVTAGAVNGIAQSVATTAGQTYVLSFDVASRVGVPTSGIEVWWRGVQVGLVTESAAAWQTHSIVLTGSGGADELRFMETAASNDSAGSQLDNVRLVVAATPPISVTENAANGTLVALAGHSDVDADPATVYALTDDAGGRFAIDAISGVVRVADGSRLDHEAATSHTIGVRVTDGGGAFRDESFTILVNDIDDTAPTSLPVTLAPMAEDSGMRLITQAELLSRASDPDSASLTATGLTLASGNGSLVDNGDGTWSFTPATDDDGAVSFSYQVSDGSHASAGSAALDLTPVSDAPVASGLGTPETYTEDLPLNLVDIVIGDVDSASVSVTLTLSNPAAGVLSVGTAGSVSSSFDSGTGIWHASGALADVNALLAGLVFTPAADFNADFSIATQVSDGVTAPLDGVKAMTGIAVAEAPLLGGLETVPLAYTENASPVALTSTLTITDVDGAGLTGATLIISGHYVAGEDELSFTDTAAITGHWDSATGTLSLSGLASAAAYQAALRSVGYANLGDDPDTVTRTVMLTASTAGATSMAVARDIAVNAINDAPLVAASATLGVTEDLPSALSGILLSDPDGASGIETATFSVATGTLSAGAAVGVMVGGTAGALSLSGTLADLNAFLAGGGLHYTTAADATAPVLLGIDLSDGGASGGGGAQSSGTTTAVLVVTPVNDEQVLIANAGIVVAENSLGTRITPTDLAALDLEQTAAELIYTLLQTPTHGNLRLAGALLAAGDHFSQADIDAGRLAYDHDGSETTADPIDFSVDDGAGTASAGRFTIAITPVNDQAPVFTGHGGAAQVAIDVATSTTVATTLTASDADLPAQTLDYRIVGGADAARFTIDATRGVLSFLVAPTDAEVNHVYTLEVQVSDGTFTSNLTLAVTVQGHGIDTPEPATPDLPTPAPDPKPNPPSTVPGEPAPEAPGASSGSAAPPSGTQDDAAELPAPVANGLAAAAPTLAFEPASEAASTASRLVAAAEPAHRPVRGDEVIGPAAFAADTEWTASLATKFMDPDPAPLHRLTAEPLSNDDGPRPDPEADTSEGAHLTLTQAAQATSVALTAGTVWWALRAGGLLTGLLVSMPAWRHADLLAVLPDDEEDDPWEIPDDDEEASRDEQAVGTVFDPTFSGGPQ